jgi:hypothetical protein
MTNKTLKTKLKNIINQENGDTLKKYVAQYWLDDADDYDNTIDWYNNLMQGGCQSGFISSLIYYSDTHAFYNKYADDIDDILADYEDMTGEAIKVKGDRRNFYAWLGFEETARQIAQELGIED